MCFVRRVTLAFVLVISVLYAACSDEGDPVAPEPGVGTISTWAGTGDGGFDGDGNTLQESSFYWPIDVEFTPTIGTYIVDWNNHRVRRVTNDGVLETVVGTNGLGDGPLDQSDQVFPGAPGATCLLNHPTDAFQRNNGTLWIVCWHNHKIREWDPASGNIWITIGREANCPGDGASALSAKVNQPVKATEGPDGSVYILDQRNQVVRKIDPADNITTVVGTLVCPTPTPLDPGGFQGDNGDPALAKMRQPTGPNPPPGGGLVVDNQGILYFADMNNHRVRRVDFVNNVITTVVGNGTAAYAGDGGPPTDASLNLPADLEIGPDGRLYIADAGNNVVRAVNFTTNRIVTVAGTGVSGFSGDAGVATSARLANPQGIAFDAVGDLYISDTFNHRIRRVKMQ